MTELSIMISLDLHAIVLLSVNKFLSSFTSINTHLGTLGHVRLYGSSSLDMETELSLYGN